MAKISKSKSKSRDDVEKSWGQYEEGKVIPHEILIKKYGLDKNDS